MQNILFKKFAFIIIALSLSSILKATSNPEQRDKLLTFSRVPSAQIQLADLAIKNKCSIPELVNMFANTTPNDGSLQRDVDGLKVVMGNIPGVNLTAKGGSIKNTINKNLLTIAAALQSVQVILGGNGDLRTRAQDLQDNIADLNQDVNGLSAVMGNIPGVNLTAKGGSIKNAINQNLLTIDSALQSVQLTLGGNGDLQTRAQALQDNIAGLQQDVNGLSAVMGNIPGGTLTAQGGSIKDTINQTSTTIAAALQSVQVILGGNGDLRTRAQDLQTTLGDFQQDSNGLLAVMGVIPGDNLTDKGRSIKDTINQISPTIASAFETLKLTLGGNGDLQTRAQDLQTTIGGLQDTINQSKTAVYGNNSPDLIPAIQAVQQLIPTPYQGQNLKEGVERMVQALQGTPVDITPIIDVITNEIATHIRRQGSYPAVPAGGLHTVDDIVAYLKYTNLDS